MSTLSDYIIGLSPLSYWRLGESSGTTAVDQMGIYTGTYTNSPTLARPGLVISGADTAVSFNGTNTYIAFTPLSNNTASAVTISMFVTLDSTKVSGSGSLIELGGLFGGKRIDVNYTTKRVSCYAPGEATVDVAIPFDVTVHLACVFDLPNALRKIYINGELVAQGAAATTTGNYGNFRIGAHTANSYYAKGTLDEVALFNKALTAAEISLIHHLGLVSAVQSEISGTITESLAASAFVINITNADTGAFVKRSVVQPPTFVVSFFPSQPVMFTITPNYGTMWKPSKVYALNDLSYPTNPGTTPYYYKRVIAGTSGAVEPTWTTTPGGLINDGAVNNAWETIERFVQPITHGPIVPV